MAAESLASSWPLMVTGVMDINTDPGCSRVTDPDMTLSCRPGPNVTMFLGGSTSHPQQPLPSPPPSLLPICLSLALPFLHHIVAHNNGTRQACECLPTTQSEQGLAGFNVIFLKKTIILSLTHYIYLPSVNDYLYYNKNPEI